MTENIAQHFSLAEESLFNNKRTPCTISGKKSPLQPFQKDDSINVVFLGVFINKIPVSIFIFV